MKIIKKVSVKGEWAKKGVDIKNGDVVKIADKGETITGLYGDQNVFKITTKTGDKNLSFNQTSLNGLHDAYGEDTENWVGKEVKISIVKQNVAGRFIDVVYVGHPSWELGENGFTNDGSQTMSDVDYE